MLCQTHNLQSPSVFLFVYIFLLVCTHIYVCSSIVTESTVDFMTSVSSLADRCCVNTLGLSEILIGQSSVLVPCL